MTGWFNLYRNSGNISNFTRSVCRNYSLLIQNVSVAIKVRFQKITICKFTSWFAKNCNLQGFKELQYVDYNMWKMVRYFFKHLYKF